MVASSRFAGAPPHGVQKQQEEELRRIDAELQRILDTMGPVQERLEQIRMEGVRLMGIKGGYSRRWNQLQRERQFLLSTMGRFP